MPNHTESTIWKDINNPQEKGYTLAQDELLSNAGRTCEFGNKKGKEPTPSLNYLETFLPAKRSRFLPTLEHSELGARCEAPLGCWKRFDEIPLDGFFNLLHGGHSGFSPADAGRRQRA